MPEFSSPSPSISIIVAVFNTAPFLKTCLQSVQAQTYRNFECICVNDGSTDDSLAVLNEFAAADARFRVVSQKNQGLSAARNTGIQYAGGEFFAFLDSDDEWSPDCLKKAFAELGGEADFCVFGVDGFVEEDGQKRWLTLPYFQSRFSAGRHAMSLSAAVRLPVTACDKLYRAEIIRKNGLSFPVGLLHEDNVFFWEYIGVCNSFSVVTEPLYHYRQARRGAITGTKKRTTHACDTLIGCRHIFEFWQQHGIVSRFSTLYPRIFSGMLKQAARHCAPEYVQTVKEEARKLVCELPLSWWQKLRMRLSIFHYC